MFPRIFFCCLQCLYVWHACVFVFWYVWVHMCVHLYLSACRGWGWWQVFFSFTLQGSRPLSEPRACCFACSRSSSCVNNSTSPPFLCWHYWQASTSTRVLGMQILFLMLSQQAVPLMSQLPIPLLCFLILNILSSFLFSSKHLLPQRILTRDKNGFLLVLMAAFASECLKSTVKI